VFSRENGINQIAEYILNNSILRALIVISEKIPENKDSKNRFDTKD